ncbi:MAG: hypothetical protein QM658_04010 [Gordonia sp. (in: high G+C Gram-positive bacteria)]
MSTERDPLLTCPGCMADDIESLDALQAEHGACWFVIDETGDRVGLLAREFALDGAPGSRGLLPSGMRHEDSAPTRVRFDVNAVQRRDRAETAVYVAISAGQHGFVDEYYRLAPHEARALARHLEAAADVVDGVDAPR